MKTSEIQIQRAISAALRKLNTDATFSLDVRAMRTPVTTDRNGDTGSCSLQRTIELILRQFENEEELARR
jgi:hypothetical protein